MSFHLMDAKISRQDGDVQNGVGAWAGGRGGALMGEYAKANSERCRSRVTVS